jgi:DNA polymerase III subunit delta'
MSAPFPWQTAAWSILCGARRAAKLGHAWLLCGRAGTGKAKFAHHFAQLSLCESAAAANTPCGECRSCHLFKAGNHPDFRRLAPLDDARSIAIDQVRELGDFFALTTHYGKAKIALLAPADAMTRAAANALLKLLEEPPALGLFILVTNQLDRLPPTIRSRCQRLALDQINPALALGWLQVESPTTAETDIALAYRLNHQAPLATLAALAAGELELAAKVETHMIGVASGRMHAVQAAQAIGEVPPARLADLMLDNAHQLNLQLLNAVHSPADGESERLHNQAGLISLINQLNSRQIFEFVTSALEVKAMSGPTANFRPADMIDLLWQAWMKATRTSHRQGTQTV